MPPPADLYEDRFTVTNASQERLSCLLTARQPPPPTSPVIILCHGYTSSKRAPLLQTLCTGLVQELPPPYAVARFDFSGNGSSTGHFRYANYEHEVEDLRAVVRYLREERQLRVQCIAGHSKGAGVVLLYAGKYGDVRDVANVAGRWEMGRGMAERFGEEGMRRIKGGGVHRVRTGGWDGEWRRVQVEFGVREADLRERVQCGVQEAVRRLGGRGERLLTVHGEGDEVIPVEDGRAIWRAGGGRLVVIEGAGHAFQGVEGRVVQEIVRFVKGEK